MRSIKILQYVLLIVLLFMVISSCTSKFFVQKNRFQLNKYVTGELESLVTKSTKLNSEQREALDIFLEDFSTVIKENQTTMSVHVTKMTDELNKEQSDLDKAFDDLEDAEKLLDVTIKEFRESFTRFYETLDPEQKRKVNRALRKRIDLIHSFLRF